MWICVSVRKSVHVPTGLSDTISCWQCFCAYRNIMMHMLRNVWIWWHCVVLQQRTPFYCTWSTLFWYCFDYKHFGIPVHGVQCVNCMHAFDRRATRIVLHTNNIPIVTMGLLHMQSRRTVCAVCVHSICATNFRKLQQIELWLRCELRFRSNVTYRRELNCASIKQCSIHLHMPSLFERRTFSFDCSLRQSHDIVILFAIAKLQLVRRHSLSPPVSASYNVHNGWEIGILIARQFHMNIFSCRMYFYGAK